MQKSNNHLTPWTFIAVPADLLEEVGIDEFSGIQYYARGGRIILEPIDAEDAFRCPCCGCAGVDCL